VSTVQTDVKVVFGIPVTFTDVRDEDDLKARLDQLESIGPWDAFVQALLRESHRPRGVEIGPMRVRR
jgi:hypothetical protein